MDTQSTQAIIDALLRTKPHEKDVDLFGKHKALFGGYGYKKPLLWPQPYSWVWIKDNLIKEDISTLRILLDLCIKAV
jgi:hypothetical protein